MRISVVIPHLNQPDDLARCLASLAGGTRPPDEVIVVDNGSVTLPRVPAAVTLLRQSVPGPGPARNLGAAHATGDRLAFIDADCIAAPDWLEQAAKADADILGGDVRIAIADPRALTALEAYESIYAYRMDRYIAREGFTGTGNLVVKRPVLETVGPFGGLHLAEDRDWGQRAGAAGFSITYAPQMRVYHPARQTVSDLFAKWDRHMAHDYANATSPLGRIKWILKTLAMGLSPLAEIPRIALCDRVPRIADKCRAFTTLTRIRTYRALRMADLAFTGRPDRLSTKWNRQE